MSEMKQPVVAGGFVFELATVQLKFDLSPSLAYLMVYLLDKPITSTVEVEARFGGTKARTMINRLRTRLMDRRVQIKTKYSAGYYFEPETRAAIIASLVSTQEHMNGSRAILPPSGPELTGRAA